MKPLTCFILLASLSAHAQVVIINELMLRPLIDDPDANLNHQWIELVNKGSDPVSLGGWKLTAQDSIAGPRSVDLPRVTLEPRSYLVVHFSQGEDNLAPAAGPRHFYTQMSARERFLSRFAGDIALYSPDAIADFFAWLSIGQSYVSGDAHAAAVAASQWTQDAALDLDAIAAQPYELLRALESGTTLGRDRNSTDTGSRFDFDVLGGRDAGSHTPGAANFIDPDTSVRAVPAPAAKPGARSANERAKWTVLFYLNTDNSLASGVTGSILEISRKGGSTADVNFVVMADRFLNKCVRGKLVGNGGTDLVANLEAPPGESIALGEENMSSASTLHGFMEWGVRNYPADRYLLILGGHGDGWKGIGPDTSAEVNSRQDFLYMNELSAGLAGHFVDIIWFQNCLMAGIEVAYQVRSSARYMIASEDIGFAERYLKLVELITNDPSMPSLDLAKGVNEAGYNGLQEEKEREYRDAPGGVPKVNSWDSLVKSVIDLSKVSALSQAVNRWAAELTMAVPLHNKRGDPTDNVQIRIQVNAAAAERFHDGNYVDMHDLATRIAADPVIPDCAKSSIPDVLSLIESQVVVSLIKGPNHPRSRGIYIHFPLTRANPVSWTSPSTGHGGLNDPYDFPSFARQSDAASRSVGYFRNVKALPLKARDREGTQPVDLAAPPEAPGPPASDFDFPRDNAWPIFLDAFYNPVAEAWIDESDPDRTKLYPETRGAGACQNGYDYVKGPIGAVINLRAFGSSDADMKDGRINPYFYDWDFDVLKDCSKPPCWQPSTVPAGSDPAPAATDNVDQDRDPANTTWDDQDFTGPSVTFECKVPGTFQIRLVAWDDHHTFNFLNTVPSAEYVFPQTNHHYAVIECTDWPATGVQPPGSGGVAPPMPVTSGAYPFVQIMGDQVISDHALQRPAPTQPRGNFAANRAATYSNTRNFESNYPITVSGTNIVQLEANGVRIPDGGRATVLTDANGVLRTRFLSSASTSAALRLEPSGLPAVQLPMTFAARLAPPPEELIVIPPQSGPLTVGQEYSLQVEARRGGQPLSDAVVTAFTADSNVEFRNGTLFRRNTANQTRSGANGRATATFRPTANGPATIEINSGALYRTYSYTATGGPAAPPSTIDVLSAPESGVVGRQAEIRLRVRAGTAPVSDARIEIALDSGTPVAVTTDANGEAVYRFTPANPVPAMITASIPSAGLRIVITVPVFATLP